MGITGTDKALMSARSGLARAGATRSNYYAFNAASSLWITLWRSQLDGGGNVIGATPIALLPWLMHDSLVITKNLNDEIDTASFALKPGTPVTVQAGEVIEIAMGDYSNRIFGGQAMRVQSRYHLGIADPWTDVQCVDWMDLFDARFVTTEYTNLSASAILTDVVAFFTEPGIFSVAGIQANMPVIPFMPATNQRPSTIVRKIARSWAGASISTRRASCGPGRPAANRG